MDKFAETSGLIKKCYRSHKKEKCLVLIRLNKPNKEVMFQPAVMGNRQPVCDYREPEQ